MPNPLEGVDQSNDPYIIVSSDTHAGLYVEDYRAYLESSVHAEFDEWLQTHHEHRAMVEEMNGEYVEQWERENEWGLQGAYDPEIRDKALDADGIAGEVIFADGEYEYMGETYSGDGLIHAWRAAAGGATRAA